MVDGSKPATNVRIVISGGGFVKNKLRSKEVKTTARGPPIVSDLPVCGTNKIATWPCGEVTHNRGLNVTTKLIWPRTDTE